MDRPAWRSLLEDPDVARWHGKLALAAETTANERARVLYRLCKALGTTPAEMAARAKDADGGRRAIESALQDFIIKLRKGHKPSDHGEDDSDATARGRCVRGHSPGYLENFVKAARSWLDHNDVTLRRIVVGDTDAAPSVEDEVLLTPAELREALTAASQRGRVVISLIAFGCLRPESIGNHDASDGLVIGDLPDLELRDKSVHIKRTPLAVVVRRELSKVKRRYLTFLPAEAAQYVKEYLEHRAARGEELAPKTPLVRPDYNRERQGRPAHMRGNPFLTTQAITSEVRDALRACGFRQRPYSLRAYAIERLMSAERDGKITRLDRMFFSGRKDAIDLRYSHFKSLSPEVVDEMRRAYAACSPYLGAKPDDTVPAADRDALKAEIVQQVREEVRAEILEEFRRVGVLPAVRELLRGTSSPRRK